MRGINHNLSQANNGSSSVKERVTPLTQSFIPKASIAVSNVTVKTLSHGSFFFPKTFLISDRQIMVQYLNEPLDCEDAISKLVHNAIADSVTLLLPGFRNAIRIRNSFGVIATEMFGITSRSV